MNEEWFLTTELEIQILHRAHHRDWDRFKTERFMRWLNEKRREAAETQ